MDKNKIDELANAAEKLTKWDSSGECFGYFESLKTAKPDRIYEFFCLVNILNDLSHKNEIIINSRDRTKNISFPKSPANKKNHSYFIIENKAESKERFQLCFGTNIKLSKSPDSTIAPDISFQIEKSTDDPDESMVELVLDAKYKQDENKKLSMSELREFCQIVSDLSVQDADSKDFRFKNLNDLNTNCLITNGKVLEIHEEYCKQRKIRQIGSFNNVNTHKTCG